MSCDIPEDYALAAGKYYKRFEYYKTFIEARTRCEEDGASLAKFYDEDDFMAIKAFVGNYGKRKPLKNETLTDLTPLRLW